MKSKDLPVLIVLVGLSALTSYFLGNTLFGSVKNLTTTVEVVQPINGKLDYLSKSYFTKDAINPTKDIQITENNNTAPLGQ